MIEPGSTIGILGGGQIGKMTAQAAASMGYKTHIYCPNNDGPAFNVTNQYTQAPYNDLDALNAFGKSVDVITFEFEHIAHHTIQVLEEHVPVYPNWQSLYISQNRLREKRFVQQLGFQTTAYSDIHTLNDLQSAMRRIQTDCLLKTVDYDSTGQHWVDSNSDLEAVWETFEAECGILEAFVHFEKEVSTIVARNAKGQCTPFPITENQYKNGILTTTFTPAQIESSLAHEAQQIAVAIAEKLDLVGLLTVAFFVTDEGVLLFNEMTPFPHDSGHWTLDGCNVSQFEQLVRAVCGLPLIKPYIHTPIRMANLIGNDFFEWRKHINNPQAKIYLYGNQIQADRKVGHINFLAPSEQKRNTSDPLASEIDFSQ